MQTRFVAHRPVSAIGVGAMPLSMDGAPSELAAVRVLHAAFDAGVTLVDTADAYAPTPDAVGHNERLVARALATYGSGADDVLVATKGGHLRGAPDWGVDGSPEHLRAACDASLAALGVECIGLYQLHRPDPSVPFVDSVGALEDLRRAGKIRAIGLSNVTVPQIDVARTVATVAAVQNEFSPDFTSSADELEHCAALGITFLPWSPLGGQGQAASVGSRYPDLAAIAAELEISPQRLLLAWMLALSPVVVPIPGVRRLETLADTVAAADVVLSPATRVRLSRAFGLPR